MPSLVSVWVLRRGYARRRWQVTVPPERLSLLASEPWVPDLVHVPGMGSYIGDLTCQFNARSPYLRCAVNPSGPCQHCRHYQSIVFDDSPCT